MYWRQKGYGSGGYKSVVKERGYDLRTKEGRALQAEEEEAESSKNALMVITVGGGALVGWLLEDSFYGYVAAYILFWLFIPFASGGGPKMLIWVVLAHLGAGAGYGISVISSSGPLEPTIWGAIIGTFAAMAIAEGITSAIFLSAIIVGCWAFFGEPSVYFYDLKDRILDLDAPDWIEYVPKSADFAREYGGGKSYSATHHSIFGYGVPSWAIISANVYGFLAYLFGLWSAANVGWSTYRDWPASLFSKILLFPFGLVVWITVTCLPVIYGFLITNAFFGITQKELLTTPFAIISFILFSSTIGFVLNRNYLFHNDVEMSGFWSFIQSACGFFWLPSLPAFQEQKTIVPISDVTPIHDDGQNSPSNSSKRAKDNLLNAMLSDRLKIDDLVILPVEAVPLPDYISALKAVNGMGEKRISDLLSSGLTLTDLINLDKDKICEQSGLGQKLVNRMQFYLRGMYSDYQKRCMEAFLTQILPGEDVIIAKLLELAANFDELVKIIIETPEKLSTLGGLKPQEISKVTKIIGQWVDKISQQDAGPNRTKTTLEKVNQENTGKTFYLGEDGQFVELKEKATYNETAQKNETKKISSSTALRPVSKKAPTNDKLKPVRKKAAVNNQLKPVTKKKLL